MQLQTTRFVEQDLQWPKSGKVVLAQFDEQSIVVYQAYKSSIGHFAAKHGCFGGDFKYSRMSWIKTNFLWMMYRSDWGRKVGQEVTLAVRLKRSAFDEILRDAVPSTLNPSSFKSEEEWQHAVATSDVRLQWDPDHGPLGEKLERRAIQLGIRGHALQHYGRDWLLDIEDISEFVAEQRKFISPESREQLQTPVERVYPVDDDVIAVKLGLREWHGRPAGIGDATNC